jgi:integrase
MAEVRYTLRDKHTHGKTVILLSFNYGEHRLRVSTGISILVSHWDFKKQRLLEKKDYPEFQEFNLHLSILAKQVINKYNEWLVQRRVPAPDEFKSVIQSQFLLKGPRENKSYFWNMFDDFIKEKSFQIKDIADYHQSLRKHLRAAEAFYDHEITFGCLKKRANGFVYLFEQYMRKEALNLKGERGLSTNTIGKQFKNLKVFLRWSFESGLVQPFSLTHLVTYSEEVDHVYLTSEELSRLEQLSLTDEQATVRDLFLIGCETGLRFSDYSCIDTKRIYNNNLEVNPKKNRTARKQLHLIIPISQRFQQIIDARKGQVPQYEEQRLHQFNLVLRALCVQAKIDGVCTIVRQKDGNTVSEQFKKWELVSSHTARRTFCTLKFLAGMPSESIMKFSGHTSERNFLKYLRLDNQLNADHFRRFF